MTAPPRLVRGERTDPSLTLAKIADVVGDHCGLVTHLTRWRMMDPRRRPLFGYGATLETMTMLGDGELKRRRGESDEIWRTGRQGRDGNRVAPDRTRAFVRAVGEALERYACGIYDPGAFLTAPWSGVKDRALDPRLIQRPSAGEYALRPRLAPFDPDAPMRWAQGWSLRDERAVLVPAQLCYVTYNTLPREPRFVSPTSTGWALHHTEAEAIHTALREVVERDSFILAWLHRLDVPRLDVATVRDPHVRAFLDGVAADGALARVLVTTTDVGVPSFAVAIADRRPGRPAFQLTLGAHPDPSRALRQAIEEAAMMRLDVQLRVELEAVDAPEKMSDIRQMSEHADFYLRQENLGPVEFILAEGARRVGMEDVGGHAVDDVADEASWMVDRLAEAGLDTIYVDTTPSDLREAGWRAAKVLVPGAARHEYGYGVRSLECPRIFDAPVRMGHRARRPTLDELNPDAHPYS